MSREIPVRIASTGERIIILPGVRFVCRTPEELWSKLAEVNAAPTWPTPAELQAARQAAVAKRELRESAKDLSTDELYAELFGNGTET